MDNIWWCNTHRRRATATDQYGRYCCDPRLDGILLPCSAGGVVNLTGMVEIVEEANERQARPTDH